MTMSVEGFSFVSSKTMMWLFVLMWLWGKEDKNFYFVIELFTVGVAFVCRLILLCCFHLHFNFRVLEESANFSQDTSLPPERDLLVFTCINIRF